MVCLWHLYSGQVLVEHRVTSVLELQSFASYWHKNWPCFERPRRIPRSSQVQYAPLSKLQNFFRFQNYRHFYVSELKCSPLYTVAVTKKCERASLTKTSCSCHQRRIQKLKGMWSSTFWNQLVIRRQAQGSSAQPEGQTLWTEQKHFCWRCWIHAQLALSRAIQKYAVNH